MRKRLLFWVPTLTVALAGVAVALPSSPFYLPDYLFRGGFHDGHPTSYWIDALKDPNAEVRSRAVHALGAIGPEAGAAVPALATILRHDPERDLRVEAALALSKMRPASERAIPALTAALGDEDRGVRMYSVIALAGLGRASRPAVPALTAALRDDANHIYVSTFTFTIQEEAAIALGRASAGTPEAVPVLMETLRTSPSDRLRQAATRALGKVGAEARPAVPLLRTMLQEKGPVPRWMLEKALSDIEGVPEGEAPAAP
jgi:HEAT repeat protein